MPNWVTSKVKAPEGVIQAMVNKEGNIDFEKIIKFDGEFPWNGILVDAETAAERTLNLPLNSHPMIGSLQQSSRDRVDVSNLSDEGFEQFIQMLRNHRKTGYLHCMDFARSAWGTKWNAFESNVDGPESASFETACMRSRAGSATKKTTEQPAPRQPDVNCPIHLAPHRQAVSESGLGSSAR
ncbi:hypothetical protein [Pseudomonas aeruginosa]|uniref:hypothetical protein n=1 Tax=Pseudomonas aeruginosa TaxID=287 RepID=UPI002076FB15|nr:hypothetical protein [Pseudomonas aeruginosa]MCM8680059.1 hypothetical protein [Pseudomonas aeruginosa]MCM8714562.1 hypothetical protein [Pseudomonas aeruginosa]MCP2640944.1 hypothetical protein [Pseudomonas aeruginosa]